MRTAFVSYLTWYHNDLFKEYGKYAVLLFDKLIIHTPTIGFIDMIPLKSVRERRLIRKSTAEYLRNIWIPIQDVIPGYQDIDFPFEKSQNEELNELVYKVTFEESQRLFPNASEAAFIREVGWGSRGLIQGIVAWTSLNALKPCGLLANNRENLIIKALFSEKQNYGECTVIGDLPALSFPDLRDVPWPKVIEMRENAFMLDFRKKVTEITSNVSSNNKDDLSEVMKELNARDLGNLFAITRPSPSKTIIKSVASNIPLPLPVNPISIGLSIKEVIDEYKRKKEYGWLYFLVESGVQK